MIRFILFKRFFVLSKFDYCTSIFCLLKHNKFIQRPKAAFFGVTSVGQKEGNVGKFYFDSRAGDYYIVCETNDVHKQIYMYVRVLIQQKRAIDCFEHSAVLY